MAVLCPAYDPVIGWYILVVGPDGPKKYSILSPLHYYHSIGVAPPVGAIFNNDDYLVLEFDLIDEKQKYLNNQDPFISMPKLSSDLHEYPPVIEVGLPKLPVASEFISETEFSKSLPEVPNGLFVPKASNFKSQYAPIIPETGVPKCLPEEAGITTFFEDKEPKSTFYSVSSSNPPPVYNPKLSTLPSDHYKNNISSYEPLPSTSNIFPVLQSPGYALFNKNVMSSLCNIYDDNDCDMEISYDDPYGEPHNM